MLKYIRCLVVYYIAALSQQPFTTCIHIMHGLRLEFAFFMCSKFKKIFGYLFCAIKLVQKMLLWPFSKGESLKWKQPTLSAL